MRSMYRLAMGALTLLILVGYGTAVADVDAAWCFGLDGHVAQEGAADHGSMPPRHASLAVPGDHGPCVDVMMPTHERGEMPDVFPPALAALTPAVVLPAQPIAAPRALDPLLPHVGFGSTLLRI